VTAEDYTFGCWSGLQWLKFLNMFGEYQSINSKVENRYTHVYA
jgi:hypothetical protein